MRITALVQTLEIESVASQQRPPDRLLSVHDGVDLLAGVADADLLCFASAETVWPPDFLERAADALANRTEAMAACADLQLQRNGTAQRIDMIGLQQSGVAQVIWNGPLPIDGVVVRADAFAELGGFDRAVTWGQRHDFMLRLSSLGAWNYLPGSPVVVPAPQSGADDALQEALLLSRFLFPAKGPQRVNPDVWRPRLGTLWYRAGRQQFSRGEYAAASASFGNASRVRSRPRTTMWRLRAATNRLVRRQPAESVAVPRSARPRFLPALREVALTRWHAAKRRRAERLTFVRSPFGDPGLPQATVVLLSFRRPQNLDRIVRLCLAARFVRKVILSNNNPQVSIRDWVGPPDDRLVLIDQPERRWPSIRFKLAREADGEHFISLDDDVFLTPRQLRELYRAYLRDTSVPHGFAGQRVDRCDGVERFVEGVSGDTEADVLNRAYFFSRTHVNEFFRLVEKLDSPLKNGEDVVLSLAGRGRPRLHSIGPVIDCPTAGKPGIAFWREPGFAEERLLLFQRVRASRS